MGTPPGSRAGTGRMARGMVGAGAAAALVGWVASPETLWAHVLLLGYFGVQIALAGAFIVALQSVTGSGWGVALRRVPEAMTAILPVSGLVVLSALAFHPGLYPWASPSHAHHGGFKDVWLARPFFLLRAVLYLAVWTGLARAMVAASRRQDEDPRLLHTQRLHARSVLFLVVFAVTYSAASFDWIMSREPEWASTVFGVYQFSGLFTAGLAAFVVLSSRLGSRGPLRGVFSGSHRHDLGKFLFGMSSFWMYIWFCQFMLIWYVNHPEETPHYAARLRGSLAPLFWLNVALNWAVPFLFLMTRGAKRSAKTLLNVSVAVLAGHGLDLYLAVLPPGRGVLDLLAGSVLAAGFLALCWVLFHRAFARSRPVPVNDPYLVESLPTVPAHRAGSEERP